VNLVLAVLTFGAIGCHTLGPLVVFSLFFGFCIGGRIIVTALIAELFASGTNPARVGQVLGFMSISSVIGELFGPPIMGALVDYNPTYVYGFILSGLIFLVATVLYDYGSELTITSSNNVGEKDTAEEDTASPTNSASSTKPQPIPDAEADSVVIHRSWIIWTYYFLNEAFMTMPTKTTTTVMTSSEVSPCPTEGNVELAYDAISGRVQCTPEYAPQGSSSRRSNISRNEACHYDIHHHH
jgi:MFS family permease